VNRWILRLLAFCAAASTATAGLALASGAQRTRQGQAVAPGVEAPVTAGTVDAESEPATRASSDSTQAPARWVARIDGRIASLRPSRHALDPAATVDPRPDRALTRDVTPLLSRSAGRLSIHVRDLDNGRVLVDVDGDRELNPASNHKILTSLAALELLGADYRFETRLLVRDDTLYVRGEGDPSLLIDDVHELVADAIASGRADRIRRVVVDDGVFSRRQFGPGYDASDAGASYMAPSGALSINFNTVEVITRPDAHGEPEVVLVPFSTMARIDAHLRTGRRHLDVATAEDEGRTVVTVRGALPSVHAPVSDRRRVHDPGLFTGGVVAAALAQQLGDAPVPVDRGTTPTEAVTVASHRSAPLREVLASAMKYSNNFTTEQVLRTLAWRATGRPGTWEDGVATVHRYWSKVGHDPEAFEFINGSGLNRDGRATARALVDLVARAAELDGDARALDAVMARSGGEGTLHHRLGSLRGRVRAKTGTMASVSALSGTVTSRNGKKRLAFSILVNGGEVDDARALQDDLVRALASYADRRG